MCFQGYTVAGSETNTFWASDLMHRLYHVPAVGQGWVDHFADGYDEVIALAKSNGTESTHDSEALQYFALEAYAFDIAAPGVGCAGESHGPDQGHDTGSASAPASTSTSSSSSASGSGATTTPTDSPSATIDVPPVRTVRIS